MTGFVGLSLSFVNVKVVVVLVFPTLSFPEVASVGLVVVFCAQLKRLESNGPAEGEFTVDPVNVHPVEVPPRVPNVLDAGPEPASERDFLTLNEPPPSLPL